MWRELVMPFQLPHRRVERQDGRGVEIVALPLVAVVVWARIAGGPVEKVRFGIVRAREPSGAATVLDRATAPGFRRRLARRRNGPEAPHALARRGFVCVQESADAFISAGDAGYDQIVDHQRGAGGPVVLPGIGHLDIPQELARETM